MNWIKRILAGWLFRGVIKDAITGNTNKDWVTIDGDPEETVGGDSARSTLRSRARALEQDSEIVRRALDVLENNVVGIGIRPELNTGNRDLDKKIEALWDLWVTNCDITGGSTFYELQKMALRRTYVDGELFVNLLNIKDGLRLQLLEPQYLDSGYSLLEAKRGHNVEQGIELDEYARPVGYWFQSKAKNPYTSAINLDSEFYDAKNILHLFFKVRPQQIRGVSLFTSIIRRIRDVDEYMDAKVIAARIAACLAVFVTSPDPSVRFGAGTETDSADATKRIKSIKPGTVNYMRPGEQIATASPSGAESGSTEVLASQLRLIALGLNLSYETLSGDLSRVNFSSGRMGSLEDRKHFKRDQQWLIDHLCRPVFNRWFETVVMKSDLNVPDFSTNKAKYLASVSWKCPGWQWVDPLKEISAHKEALKAGLITLSEVCAQLGLDYAEVLEQLGKEKQLAEEFGLTLDIFQPETPQVEGGGDEKDDEGDDENGED